MSARMRKALGGVLILLFLVAYSLLASVIGDHLPPGKLIQLGYFVVVGTAWGAPLIPLITWMNRGRAGAERVAVTGKTDPKSALVRID